MKKSIILIFIALQGCGALDRQIDAKKSRVLGLSSYYNYSVGGANYYLQEYRNAQTASAKVEIRGRVVYELMSMIDLEFWEFSRSLRHNKAYKDSFVSIVSIGLTTAGALSSGVAAQNLSAVDTILKGGNSVVDSTAFGDKAPELLINQMIVNRSRVAQEIYAGLTASDEAYPLQAAIKDLSRYYQEGSVTAALTSLVGRTAADAVRAVEAAASGAKAARMNPPSAPAASSVAPDRK